MVTADHGPAVSGAHNTIVCARAGKDLISSLTSGLLTIVSTAHVHWAAIFDRQRLTILKDDLLMNSRETASEALWMQLQSNSARRSTAACYQWSLSTR